MIEADRLLAERLQAREQKELKNEEKARLFVELLEKRKKHFAALRAQEKMNKPPTKAQKKSTMSTYLKHMAGYKQIQLKNKSFAEIQKLFDKAMTRVNMFVDMDTELVKESSKKAEAEIAQESSFKRAGEELEQEVAKKQKMKDDKEREDLQQCFKIVIKEDVVIDAIPLATKPAVIVDYKIHRKGKQGYYEIMRADGSSKIYLLFSQLIKSFDREDLETLWKLVKAKHGNTRPEEGYERVLWGDLKTMFEHHVEDLIWRNLQGKKVLLWRLYDSCGIHFVRFEDMHVYMLVEKRYPLTPATITDMLNKKLKSDYWNEMCYQLLKLMTKQLKKQIVGIKRLLDDLEVTAAKVRVTAVKHNLVLLINFDETYAKYTARVKLVLLVKIEENILSSYYCLYTVNAAGTKLQLLKRLRLLKEFLLSRDG
ncbi:hypothetical protein Tco_0144773 [Tanacetum coccineum]